MRMQKLAVIALGLLIVSRAGAEDAVKKEWQQLQGAWTVVGAEQDGQPLDRIKGGTMQIKDINFDIKTKGGTEMKGDLQIDPAKKPKTMDMVHQEGMFRNKTWQAIYELDGDNLKICYVEPDKQKERPSDFTTAQESFRLLVHLKREKK